MSAMSIKDFTDYCEMVLESRGLVRGIHVACDRFISDFVAYAWVGHHLFGDGVEMLDVLATPEKTDAGKWNTNFRSNLLNDDLADPRLNNNQTWEYILPFLVATKGKGIGVGELVLPLIVPGWTYSNTSDGDFHGKREVKNGGTGSSLKPIPTGATDNGLVDRLNEEYFEGYVPGMVRSHSDHAEYVADLDDPIETYIDYLSELYPNRPVKLLAKNLIKAIDDVKEWSIELGLAVLGWYQKNEDFESLILIDPNTLDIVNIATPTRDVSKLGVKFTPKMKRGNDTQAVPDGYVNISIR